MKFYYNNQNNTFKNGQCGCQGGNCNYPQQPYQQNHYQCNNNHCSCNNQQFVEELAMQLLQNILNNR